TPSLTAHLRSRRVHSRGSAPTSAAAGWPRPTSPGRWDAAPGRQVARWGVGRQAVLETFRRAQLRVGAARLGSHGPLPLAPLVYQVARLIRVRLAGGPLRSPGTLPPVRLLGAAD